MSLKPAMFFASALVLAGLIASPIAAQAGGMSHMGTYGGGMSHPAPAKTYCPQPSTGGGKSTGIGTINVYKPVSINNNVNVYKPTTINNDINVYKPVTVTNNIDNSKNIDINKPVTINKTIDNSKNININNNIDASKNIDIDKTIIINKGGQGGSQSSSQADAAAEAAAVATAVAAAISSSNSSSNAMIDFNGGNSSSASNSSSSSNSSGGSESSSSAFGFSGSGTAIGGSSYIAETPGPFAGGDLGTITVEAAPTVARAACTFQEATVIKAIHAVCVSADNHEFPASHMVPDTWIDASYEGEIARCIPGSHLKVTVGAVFQSNEGMASSWSHGQTLECAPHEAVRHFKDGMLKCAPALPVPDCTERTNLRKYGTADMFFTYRTKVCLETHEEYSEVAAHDGAAESFEGSGNTLAP